MEAIRPKLVALLGLWLLAATGCHRLPASWYYAWNGYPQEPIETPFDREQAYKQLAVTAAQKPPEEQERTAEMLSQALGNEESPVVRAQIVRTLAAYPTATSAAAMQRALNDSHEHVRAAACDAWARRGGEEAASTLATVLRTEKSPDVRLRAVRALGNVKDGSAVKALAIALQDNNVAIQNRAMASLESITGRYYGTDVNAWLAFAQGQEVPPKDRSVADRVHDFIYR
jgi:HEAT repeat protein